MSHDPLDDSPVDPATLAAWARADVIDPAPFDDAFFDALADDIEAAIDAPVVAPLRPRRWIAVGASLAAAAALALALLPGEPALAPAPEADDPMVDAARSLGASALAAVLADDAEAEAEPNTLLATRDWLATPEDDALPAGWSSLLEELDDLDDYDSLFAL